MAFSWWEAIHCRYQLIFPVACGGKPWKGLILQMFIHLLKLWIL